MTSRATELRWVSLAFVLLAIVFVAFPEIDLAVSAPFYHAHWQLPTAFSEHLRNFFYHAIPALGLGLLFTLAALLALSFSRRFSCLKGKRSVIGFLLFGALLGPVLLVDFALKDHWGRARPSQVEEFGGQRHFTPALVPAQECEKNCSFVSGHVATAAFVMAFGWLSAPAVRRRWLIIGTACAAGLAWTRITMGGHFLSDTLFAWFVTYYSLWLTELIFRWRGWLAAKPPPESP